MVSTTLAFVYKLINVYNDFSTPNTIPAIMVIIALKLKLIRPNEKFVFRIKTSEITSSPPVEAPDLKVRETPVAQKIPPKIAFSRTLDEKSISGIKWSASEQEITLRIVYQTNFLPSANQARIKTGMLNSR